MRRRIAAEDRGAGILVPASIGHQAVDARSVGLVAVVILIGKSQDMTVFVRVNADRGRVRAGGIPVVSRQVAAHLGHDGIIVDLDAVNDQRSRSGSAVGQIPAVRPDERGVGAPFGAGSGKDHKQVRDIAGDGVGGEIDDAVGGVDDVDDQTGDVVGVGAETVIVDAVGFAVVIIGFAGLRPAQQGREVHRHDADLAVGNLLIIIVERPVGRVTGVGSVFRRIIECAEEHVIKVGEREPGRRSPGGECR